MPRWFRCWLFAGLIGLTCAEVGFSQTRIIEVAPDSASRRAAAEVPRAADGSSRSSYYVAQQAALQTSSSSAPRNSERVSSSNTETHTASGSGSPLPDPGRLPLAPRPQAAPKAGSFEFDASNTATTVFSSLAIVLGLFFLLAWLYRRTQPKGSLFLPNDAVESLGRAPLAHRQFMHLVRIGRKLVLLSVTPTGAETLTEISDPDEVEHLLAICQQNNPHSISESFRQILSQFADEESPTSPSDSASTLSYSSHASRPQRRRAA